MVFMVKQCEEYVSLCAIENVGLLSRFFISLLLRMLLGLGLGMRLRVRWNWNCRPALP